MFLELDSGGLFHEKCILQKFLHHPQGPIISDPTQKIKNTAKACCWHTQMFSKMVCHNHVAPMTMSSI